MKAIKGPAIFLAQFMDDLSPFNEIQSICKWASSLGYKGVQIPTWDSRCINLEKVANSKDYADEYKAKINACGVEITELSTHLQGQLIAVNPVYDKMFDGFAPEKFRNDPKKRMEWAINQLLLAAQASKNLGIKISYVEQKYPEGLPEAFIIGEKFIGKNNVALILGDNFFYGQNLTEKLRECTKLHSGATVFLHPVHNPSHYGVAKISKKNRILKIIEKPKKYLSNLAITGLYFFDNNAVKYSKSLKPSKRKEIEIVDLLNKYLKKNKLFTKFIGRGGAWFDAGSINDFYDASSFVSTLENRQGLKIACLEEIALGNNWISKKQIISAIKFYGKCDYSNYLRKLVK